MTSGTAPSKRDLRQEITDQSAAAASSADEPDDNIAFDRMSEEDLLAGIEGLVPPEKSDEY